MLDQTVSRAVGFVRTAVPSPQSLAEQEAQIREYAEREGWQLSEIFSDVGSGTADGAELARLMGSLADVDVLLVPSLDRLARSTEKMSRLLAQLEASGVKLVSVRRGPIPPALALTLETVSALARFESEAVR